MSSPLPQKAPQTWQCQIGTTFVDHRVMQVVVRGLKTGQKLDKKTGAGTNRGTISITGDDFASWSLALEAGWESDAATPQESWQALEALCVYVHQHRRQPLPVYHPMLDRVGVNAMLVEEIEWPEQPTPGGILRAKFKCTEWAPPPKKPTNATTTPVGEADSVFDPKKGKTKPDFTPPAKKGGPASGVKDGFGVLVTSALDGSGAIRPSKPSATLPKP